MQSGDLEEAQIFVGADRSQLLAVKVLEFSIKRRTKMSVMVRSMHDLDLPDPQDLRQAKRTGFSFTRFAIPELTGYRGRALYLDADMLVLRDLRELYGIPFGRTKVHVQEELPEPARQSSKDAARRPRAKQCSVMLLDCAALDWDVRKIIAGLDGDYTYEELMHQLCILAPEEIGHGVPFAWNSLETYEPGRTGLLHYTDMPTQPWVFASNPNGYLWLNEVRAMLIAGALTPADIEEEIKLGYFRPSLLRELEGGQASGPPSGSALAALNAIDSRARFIAHAEVRRREKERKAALSVYEASRNGRKMRVGTGLIASFRRQVKDFLA